ncbi:DUF805 domain-containing protein [Amnibacterium kyonggiense]|uniref:Uncharacterized membrane protein YhaH (DUF805 family) n=1 Tax=Amnibacterium kyonggiense TaxID=595671 RepID=A0A4R7FPU2_9MICO|nr:DUF805 domain-containing protein [Amnibacterium kyonggiense]TDS79775.1 uncharacterized membrane protein YhaH (DUF805 family) [Amnibacterium kyonggiense]
MPVDPTDPDLPLYGASPLTAYARYWKRYVVFTGRASLSEYWWSVLLSSVIAIALGVLGGILLAVGAALAQQGSAAAAIPNALGAVLLFALVAFALAQIVPGIAISVRRLHDANLSGLLYLLAFIPSVGGLILLVLNVLPSNPEGRRFDAGAPLWQPVMPQPVVASGAAARPAPTPAPVNGGFDAWPAPSAPPPATAPLPVTPLVDAAPEPDDAIVAAWRTVGRVDRVEAKLGMQPSWRRQAYLIVRRDDGVEILTTDGLGEEEGAAALGAGAEVYLAGRDLGATPEDVADGWRFTLVAAVARRIGASGMHLPAELEQYGALSMSVPADAPAEWRTPDGGVGVLIGVGLPGVPEAVATTAGEVRLVGLVPLRPEELQRILDGGRDARSAIAGRLAALPPAVLTDPARPAV